HICVLHDVGHQDGTAYLVMEYLEGQTVAERLEKGALPMDEALKIGAQIADALDKAHRQGVVHRDLKPSNVMMTKSGANLLDFGVGEAKGGRGSTDGQCLGGADECRRDRAGYDSWHVAVHVAGTARGTRRGRPIGHLCIRCGPL